MCVRGGGDDVMRWGMWYGVGEGGVVLGGGGGGRE